VSSVIISDFCAKRLCQRSTVVTSLDLEMNR
jgi:hypothetical protein